MAEHGDAELVELGVPEERGPVAPSVRVHFFLLGELHAAAVDEPYEGAVEPLRDVRDPEDIVSLARDPRACHDLVVEPDDDAPPAVYPPKAVDDASCPRFLFHGVVENMKGRPGARIEDILEPLMDRPFPPLGKDRRGEPRVLLLLHQLCDLLLDLLDLLGIRRVFLYGFSEFLHLLKIGSHPCLQGWVNVLCYDFHNYIFRRASCQ